MSLKELTKDKHTLAEQTPFMQAVFKGTLTLDTWVDYTYQKSFFYNTIELLAEQAGLLDNLPGIKRTELLKQDYKEMMLNKFGYHIPKESTKDYIMYLRRLVTPDDIMAHLYTWHMGDLFGGQMIKRVITAPHRSLEFENADLLKNNIRVKLNDSMGIEANRAFDWSIQILNEYIL